MLQELTFASPFQSPIKGHDSDTPETRHRMILGSYGGRRTPAPSRSTNKISRMCSAFTSSLVACGFCQAPVTA